MNRTKRTLSRVAGLALVLGGATLAAAGQASANDRAVVVSCTDHTAGTWKVSVTFSSIEVKVDRPVDVTLGSAHATLTEPGPNGTVTLSQSFGAGEHSANLTWSIVRLDYQNMGVLNLDQPADCRVQTDSSGPPASEAPPTAPPSTEAAPTTTPAVVPPASAPVTPQPVVRVEAAQALPETGSSTLPGLALGAGAVLGGLALVGIGRRRPEQA
jgi:LPXTG-motif cell wall-anchored protein